MLSRSSNNRVTRGAAIAVRVSSKHSATGTRSRGGALRLFKSLVVYSKQYRIISVCYWGGNNKTHHTRARVRTHPQYRGNGKDRLVMVLLTKEWQIAHRENLLARFVTTWPITATKHDIDQSKISSSKLFAFILHNVDIILQYHDNKDLERLVVVLMAILDRQEKLQLLKDIRSTVDTHHQSWLCACSSEEYYFAFSSGCMFY